MLTPLLYGILIPAILAGITWGLAWRIWNRDAPPIAGTTWAGALAIALAFIAGFILLSGAPGWPPKLAEDWLPYLAVAAVFLGLLELAIKPTNRFHMPINLTFVGVSVSLLTKPLHSAWAREFTLLFWICGLSLLCLYAVIGIKRIAEKHPGASLPLSLWIWAAGCAAALTLTGSIKYGQLAGIPAAALGAGVVAAWIKPRISFAGGFALALEVILGGLLLCGYFYSELPASAALILAVAPLFLLLGELGFIARRKPWQAALIRAAIIAVPVAIALLIAAWPMLTAKPEDSYYR